MEHKRSCEREKNIIKVPPDFSSISDCSRSERKKIIIMRKGEEKKSLNESIITVGVRVGVEPFEARRGKSDKNGSLVTFSHAFLENYFTSPDDYSFSIFNFHQIKRSVKRIITIIYLCAFLKAHLEISFAFLFLSFPSSFL